MGTAALLRSLGCPGRVPTLVLWGRSLVGLGQLYGEMLWTGD